MQTLSQYTRNLTPALLGLRHGIAEAESIRSYSNKVFNTNTYTGAITAADLATTITLTNNDGTVSKAVTVNAAAATLTVGAIAALLVAAINADDDLKLYFTAADLTSGDFSVAYNFPGQDFTVAATTNLDAFVESVVETTTTVTQFGFGVVFGADEDAIAIPASGKVFCGVVVRDAVEINDGVSTTGVAAGRTVPVLRKGLIWVKVMEAVAAGDTAYCSYASSYQGQFRNDNTSALATGGVFVQGGSAGGMALLQL